MRPPTTSRTSWSRGPKISLKEGISVKYILIPISPAAITSDAIKAFTTKRPAVKSSFFWRRNKAACQIKIIQKDTIIMLLIDISHLLLHPRIRLEKRLELKELIDNVQHLIPVPPDLQLIHDLKREAYLEKPEEMLMLIVV